MLKKLYNQTSCINMLFKHVLFTADFAAIMWLKPFKLMLNKLKLSFNNDSFGFRGGSHHLPVMHWPLTCCSRLRITATAWCSTSSLVWGFSLFRCSWHMWPSSLKASLMSRTRRRSRALLAILLSRSRSAFCSGLRSSSSWMLTWRSQRQTE